MGANLNRNVIVTGGVYAGKNDRDEVSSEFPSWWYFAALQVIEYDVVTGRWSEVGHMQRGRYNHAIVGVNLGAICHIGNLKLSLKTVKCRDWWKMQQTWIQETKKQKLR